MENENARKLRKFVSECRDLARRTDRREDREKLEEMAKSWEELAKALRKSPG